MILESTTLSGLCACGRDHAMETRRVIIEAGCLKDFDRYCEDAGVAGERCVLYDSNTYHAKGLTRPAAMQEIILPAEGLHADEHATARVLEQLDPRAAVIVAIGAGTIHDTARYCANERGLVFVACPTAASVDGFTSTVSAMTWHGNKTTLPGIAPRLVLADTDVIRQAPPHLALSGVGDIVGKYTSLADWKISHALTGDHFCPRIEGLTREAIEKIVACCGRLGAGDADAYEQLTYGLILSGLAMQMMGNSRAASGSEHHISHLIEMNPPVVHATADALHGEKVGVATAVVAGLYHRLAGIEDIASHTRPYAPLDEAWLIEQFGPALVGGILKENENDCLREVTEAAIVQAWPEIQAHIAEIPSEETLVDLLKSIGAKHTLASIGVTDAQRPMLLTVSPTVRNRLTLARTMRMLDIAP